MWRRIKISRADKLFSELVRTRSGFRCERCNKLYPSVVGLQCSHFHTRGKKSVRFDPENAAALCAWCHQHFTANPLEHTEWFRKRLGPTKFDALTLRANVHQKVDEKLICLWLKQELKGMRKAVNDVHQ